MEPIKLLPGADGVIRWGNPDVAEQCPRCGAVADAYAVGVGQNDDGSTFIYCSCGYVLDGIDEDRVLNGDPSRPSPFRGVIKA